jgi:hypothetical protein
MIDTDTYELTQMINRNNHEVSETIQYLNMLVSDIRNNHKELADKLEDDNFSLADRTGKCFKCGGNMVEKSIHFQSSEYFGQPVQERIPIYGCESCGYIKE